VRFFGWLVVRTLDKASHPILGSELEWSAPGFGGCSVLFAEAGRDGKSTARNYSGRKYPEIRPEKFAGPEIQASEIPAMEN
jgi:hypothetical protein